MKAFLPIFYGLLAVAVAGGVVTLVKSGGHVQVAAASGAKTTGKPGKKPKAKAKVLDPEDPEYIAQFRLCVAGVDAACERVGKNGDGTDRQGAVAHAGEGGEDETSAAPRNGVYDDPSSKVKAKVEVFDEKVVRIALASARSLTACGKSKAAKCDAVRARSVETVASLKRLQERTSRACRNRQHDACLIRGDLDEALGRRSDALVWFGKARSHASNVQSRCDDGVEKRKAPCKAAASTLTATAEREDRIKEQRIKGH